MTINRTKKHALQLSSIIVIVLLFSFFHQFYTSNHQSFNSLIFKIDTLNNILIPQSKSINYAQKNKNATNDHILLPLKSGKFTSLILPNFSVYKNTNEKKKAFFNFLKPFITDENKRIVKQRLFIEEQFKLLHAKESHSKESVLNLESFIRDYRCNSSDLEKEETYNELLERVDIIPHELALVQAALESSWGSSYFALLGNNLFGLWCFKPGCGLVPRARKAGETHQVAKFKNLSLNVQAYMLFLNSHPLFRDLRDSRAKSRANGQTPSSFEMAKGLKAYSARGNKYIGEVQSMIKTNKIFLNDIGKTDKAFGLSAINAESN